MEYDDGIDGPRVWLGHMDVPGLAMLRLLRDSTKNKVRSRCYVFILLKIILIRYHLLCT